MTGHAPLLITIGGITVVGHKGNDLWILKRFVHRRIIKMCYDLIHGMYGQIVSMTYVAETHQDL